METIRQDVRYALRTDGFVSVNAPFGGGSFVTKPLTFTGRELVVLSLIHI